LRNGVDRQLDFAPLGLLLHSGDNTVAAVVFQANNTSSDITMGLRAVLATTAPLAGGVGATMHISRDAGTGQVTISWTGTGTLQRTTDVGPTAAWSDVTSTSPFQFTPTGPGHAFFRVR